MLIGTYKGCCLKQKDELKYKYRLENTGYKRNKICSNSLKFFRECLKVK